MSFPPSINPFLNAIVSINLVTNINFEILVRRRFLQVAFVLNKISVSDLLGFDNHKFCFVGVNINTHGRAKILKKS